MEKVDPALWAQECRSCLQSRLGGNKMWGFPQIRGTILGVLIIIRTIIYWGLYWGPSILGNYHVEAHKFH